ncbi:unnamed protein product [Rotaria sp. Silwood2]|nr:unnamed protein product [Rotaria sp. Silwood2]
MTSNNVEKVGNFGNIIYDSDNDTPGTRRRIGISATEIELLDDIPPSFGTGITSSKNTVPNKERLFESQIPSSSINKENQPNNYQALSFNKEQPKSNIAYHDGNDQQLNFAVDKLLEKYAPDALPQNLVNASTSSGQPSQVNVVTARDDSFFSSFQTTAPSSSTTSNNYSTIIRPNKGQVLQTNTKSNNNHNNNNNHSQPPTRSQPEAVYNSIQYAISPQQPQQKPQSSIPIKTKTGNVAQVVPGKLYTLLDDPLHIFYDRQYPTPSQTKPPSQQQQPSFQTTFQPSNNFQTTQDPLVTMFTNAPTRNPQQPMATTTDNNSNGVQPFNLESLIKRVQQDYYQEIKPFVSSVRFVEKDREYGQSLADIGFVTPISVRRGFTKQADDILRRSFGQQAPRRQPFNRPDPNDYSDDEEDDHIDDLHPPNRYRPPLEKFDSKQSFTSVTSVSTYSGDYDDPYSSPRNRKKTNVHDQSTSPPPKPNQTKTQPQIQNSAAASMVAPMKPMTKDESDEEDDTTTANNPIVPKLAKRISPDRYSMSSADATTSDDEDDYIASYNEHENPKNSRSNGLGAVNAKVTNSSVVEPIDKKTGSQTIQRSEDIHPVPPTIRVSQTNLTSPKDSRTEVKKIGSEGSDIGLSESDEDSSGETEDKSSTPLNKLPSPLVNQSNVQPTPTSATSGRPTITPQMNARGPIPQTNVRTPTTQTNARTPTTQTNTRTPTAPTNPRVPATQNAPSATRTNNENNPRQATGSTTNPTNQRSTAAPERNAASGPANTGSTRLFNAENNSKSANKRSAKDGSSSFKNKMKSLFSRKQS